MSVSAFCIHGHFYQPPREDPLTGIIPDEEGAYPYNNWNERILAHCYKPNADLENFSRISFNLGPTVLEWMSKADPGTLESIVEQERKNFTESGFPNGMAQAYNHTILPLASYRDKQTQIKWGMQEFQIRFGHAAEGLWFPEAAVNSETMRVAADCGVRYVILAPWQCADQRVNLLQPAWVELGQGKKLAVFFYNQMLSTRVSFDPGSTRNADEFLTNILLPELSNGRGKLNDKYLIIASDGELYGHHQRFRDQFLARLTTTSCLGKPVEQITPAVWLKAHPPTQTATIVENTSWSCYHGILRWSKECECTPNSQWKEPLGSALNLVAEAVDLVFERTLEKFCADPYAVRNEYIQVLAGNVYENEFIHEKTSANSNPQSFEKVRLLLKAQYERQRMFTSCGWFFEDFDRIEPRNNVKYAAQSIWLTQQVKPDLNLDAIIHEFGRVTSTRTDLKGDQVFQNHLRSAQAFWSGVPSNV